jgi:hypothetical protein
MLSFGFVSGHDFSRAVKKERELGFSPCNGTSCTKCIAHMWFRTLSKQDWYTYLTEKKAQGLKPRSLLAFYGPTKVVP